MLGNIECRLCSSTTELISLFNGKCRKNRDYIRKLIDLTTGVKFQKNDECKCICFACTIQIYNFYIFRARSIENEKQLQQVCTKGKEKINSHKIEVADLDDIVLPDTEELKEKLMPWFISKRKYCDTENIKTGINIINSRNADHNIKSEEHKLINSSTQYDLVEHVVVATQYELSSLETSTQTNKLATKTKKIQCMLGQLDENSKTVIDNSTQYELVDHAVATQYELSSLENSTQTNKLPTRTKKIQCMLRQSDNESQGSTTQTSEVDIVCNLVEKIDKNTQCECSSVDVCTQANPEKNECKECDVQTDILGTFYDTSSIKLSTQTVKLPTRTKKIQSKLIKVDRKLRNRASTSQTSENDSICNLIEKTDRAIQCGCSTVDVSTQINEEKNECKECSMQTDTLGTHIGIQIHKLATRTKKIQCKLEKPNRKSCNKVRESTIQPSETNSFCDLVEKVEKVSQYEHCNVEVSVQTDTPSFKESKECSTQTDTDNNCDTTESPNAETKYNNLCNNYEPCYTRFSKRNQETPKKDKELSTQNSTPTEVLNSKECSNESFSKETQCDLYIIQGYARRKSLMPNSVKIQGVMKSNVKPKIKCIESTTQTDISYVGNCAGGLCNDYFGPINMPKRLHLDIKQEIETPPMLSPANCLNINCDGTKTEPIISPALGCVSPRSSSLLALKDKVEKVIICPECDRTVYSKSQYKSHKKSHMRCNFCRKKFRSLKKTKLHKEYYCDIQKLTKTVPVVTLMRLESLTDVQKKYPECLDLLKDFNELDYSGVNGEVKKVVRIRSRSVSDMDSVMNCTTCKSCISVLKGVSLGVDKSVQANLIFDTDLIFPLESIYKNVCLKRELEGSLSGDGCQLKKIKLSAPVSG